MKNKILWDKSYRRLIKKVFVQIAILTILALIIVITLRESVEGKLGNIITDFICSIYDVSWYQASNIYLYNVRPVLVILIIASVFIFFLLFFWILLNWFKKYFDEIIGGVNELASGKKQKIKLSQELDFIEEKLNKVNNDLIRSAELQREAEKRKNDLVVYLAHDIKTPLTSVIGYLSLLDEKLDIPSEQREKYTHITLEKALRLENMINELFEITRYNSNDITLEKINIDLFNMLIQLKEEFYPVIEAGNKHIEIYADEDISIYADPKRLARVFGNILRNASAYSKDNSTIKVTVQQQKDNVIIEFENQGNPIPEDQLENIFNQFLRLDPARATNKGGAGLGLAIAKEIVTLHGGTINARSDVERTVFSVALPKID